ncbi:hypothetical protein NW754_001738 [Fusarium falciforme]|nr:hypothetical protein NW754_001738 [Fusarium falciforme]
MTSAIIRGQSPPKTQTLKNGSTEDSFGCIPSTTEAAACFEQVIKHDPECAMGYWGAAFASGPNYNKVWMAFDERDLNVSLKKCYDYSRKAKELSSAATPAEQGLIEALQHRFPSTEPPKDFTPAVLAYADAMRQVHRRLGKDDLDVITLTADALMNTAPWKLYEAMTGKPNLETPFWRFTTCSSAVWSFQVQRSTPESFTFGDYRRALYTNLAATIADDKYYAREGGKNFYSFYRMHNYHSLINGAMMAGQAREALEATARMEATITEDMLLVQSPPLRIGSKNKDLYCVMEASTHYGKAIAWAATENVEEADKERELFHEALKRVPETRLIFPNKVLDVFQVAVAMLDGEIEYRRGDYKRAFESLRLAIERDDSLIYAEPWPWMLPARHPYAALLLEQGHVEEAAQIYAEDLGLDDKLVRALRHQNNIWALHGYHECLVRLGRTAEARIIQTQLAIAAAGADIEIKSSCFCRLETMENGKQSCCK